MDFNVYSLLFKTSYLTLLVPSIIVIVSAAISSRELGGTMGQALKKIATGTVLDTILVITYVFLERGLRGMFDDAQVRLFFIMSGMFASVFLISGYLQMYRISRKLKLFTP